MREERHHFSPTRFYAVNIIFLIPLIILAIIVFLILATNVTAVEVKGNSLISDAEIEGLVMTGKYKNNGAYDVIKNRLRPAQIPFVKSASVSLKNFHTLVISVKEKKLAGYVCDSKNNYVYLDDDGTVTEIDSRLLGNAIPVEGITTKKKITEGAVFPAAENRIKALSTIFKTMTNQDIAIEGITFGSSGQITLDCGDITASMGTADSLKEKLLRLANILPKVDGMTGILHFEDYTADNTDIVFEKTKTN